MKNNMRMKTFLRRYAEIIVAYCVLAVVLVLFTWITRRKSSGQIAIPIPCWAMASVVAVLSVSSAILGLKACWLQYWSTMLRVRLPRFSKTKGIDRKAAISAPSIKARRTCSACPPG